MQRGKCYCAAVASGTLFAFACPPGTLQAGEPEDESSKFRPSIAHELSAGGISRIGHRDPGLIGRANGGTGTSVNFDDGNLNYGRGLASFAVQGRSIVTGGSDRVEVGLEAVYFYDFVNADGHTDFHNLSEEAITRAGRNIYVNEAFIGFRQRVDEAMLSVRAGNQRLRWSDSAWFGQSIAPVNAVAASRRYQPGNT
ncbi:MAG: DUF1302 family protein, partial [Burkholderiales bacterium]